MNLKDEDICALKKTGLCDKEIHAILAAVDEREQIRQLRKLRCQLLNEIHGRQQTLDHLDYVIHQTQSTNEEEKRT